ncbi:MAG: transcriptional repressor [Dehalococcoidales bacterium]|nr:transcriptional repressor [Dehalococcoidales bacterium]
MSRNRRDGLKKTDPILTPQRQAILEAMRRSGNLLDARELYRLVNSEGETISLATIYRSLNFFREKGVIDEYSLGKDRCCYELKHSSEHQHLKCKCCGRIFGFECPSIAEIVRQIREEKGFIIEKIEICIQGTCLECRKKRGDEI